MSVPHLRLAPSALHPLVLPGEPWAKKRPRISKGGGRTHQSKIDREAEKRTRQLLIELWDRPPYLGNLGLGVRFYRSTRNTVDADNLLKHVLDAGTGPLWINDCQVTLYEWVELQVDRVYPRTELWFRPHTTTMIRLYDPDTGKAIPHKG